MANNFLTNLFKRRPQMQPDILPTQMNEMGQFVPQQEFDYQAPLVSEFGLQANVQPQQRFQGLRNFMEGFRENAQTPFAVENLEHPSRGGAFRAGEILGSLGRGLASPIGRAALTAGAVGAFGGSPLEMAAFGGQAGVTNQQLKMQDRLYREELEALGIDTSNVPGYISGDAFQRLAMGSSRMGIAGAMQHRAETQRMRAEDQSRMIDARINNLAVTQRQNDQRIQIAARRASAANATAADRKRYEDLRNQGIEIRNEIQRLELEKRQIEADERERMRLEIENTMPKKGLIQKGLNMLMSPGQQQPQTQQVGGFRVTPL